MFCFILIFSGLLTEVNSNKNLALLKVDDFIKCKNFAFIAFYLYLPKSIQVEFQQTFLWRKKTVNVWISFPLSKYFSVNWKMAFPINSKEIIWNFSLRFKPEKPVQWVRKNWFLVWWPKVVLGKTTMGTLHNFLKSMLLYLSYEKNTTVKSKNVLINPGLFDIDLISFI